MLPILIKDKEVLYEWKQKSSRLGYVSLTYNMLLPWNKEAWQSDSRALNLKDLFHQKSQVRCKLSLHKMMTLLLN